MPESTSSGMEPLALDTDFKVFIAILNSKYFFVQRLSLTKTQGILLPVAIIVDNLSAEEDRQK